MEEETFKYRWTQLKFYDSVENLFSNTENWEHEPCNFIF